MATLSPRDAERWERLTRRVADLVERLLGPEVLGNRATSDGRPRSLRPSLRRARTAASRLAAGSPVVVRLDVREFYASVTPCTLHEALRSAGADAGDARMAAGMVEGWGGDGYAGLPIGPAPSAVMANAVLAPVDEALQPWRFLRWVDDYLVGVPSERAAREVLERADEALDRVGLRRAREKTAIERRRDAFGWLGMSFATERPAAGARP